MAPSRLGRRIDVLTSAELIAGAIVIGAVIVASVNMWTYNRAIQKRHQRRKAALEQYIRRMDKGMEPRARKL